MASSTTVKYVCERCSKQCTDMADGILAVLRLCEECQAKRYAKGLAVKARAEAEEAARGAR